MVKGLDLSPPRMPLVNNQSRHGDIRQEILSRVDSTRGEFTPARKAVIARVTLADLHADLPPDVAKGNPVGSTRG